MANNFSIKLLLLTAVLLASIWIIKQDLPQGSGTDAQVVLRLAEGLPETSPVTKAMYRFAELVKQKTDGQVIVKVYASGQLGQQVETIEQTRLGIIDFTRTNSVVMANVSQSVGVLTLPYVFAGHEHKYRVLDGDVGGDIRDELGQIGLVGFDFLESGVRSFYTTAENPITSLADLEGLKIRVQPAPIMIRMIELLGAVPTPMNYGEVYSALQTGVVDGAENDYISYSTSGHFEVAGNYVEDGHLSPPAMLLMNQNRFKSLKPEFQQAIQSAAREMALEQRQTMVKANLEAKAMLLEKGVSITSIDKGPFVQAMQPIYDEFPMFADYLKRIQELRQ